MTYTYAILEVSKTAYDEIKRKLLAAGYSGQFHKDNGQIVIDMHGIALTQERNDAESTTTETEEPTIQETPVCDFCGAYGHAIQECEPFKANMGRPRE